MNEGMSAIGTKRTLASALHMSAFDQKPTSLKKLQCAERGELRG
jgi:hypothetical protein